jgi:hypothetical protein
VELIFFITVNLMVPDKEIDNAPKASKAHAPKFSLTQQGTYAPKKKLKR